MATFPTNPDASPLDGTEVVPLTQAGVDKKVTTQKLADANESKSANVASAAALDLASATTPYVHVTGTTTVTSITTLQAGTRRRVVFDGILTLTHNGTSLILPTGSNITTAAGDVAVFVSEGSGNWRCVDYTRANGTALSGGAGGDRSTVTAVTSSSGVVTLNYLLGDYFTLALSENVTSWVISNPPGSGHGFSLIVQITQDSTPRTVAKPGTTSEGAALDVSTASGAVDLLAISSLDNGTTLRSTIAKDFS